MQACIGALSRCSLAVVLWRLAHVVYARLRPRWRRLGQFVGWLMGRLLLCGVDGMHRLGAAPELFQGSYDSDLCLGAPGVTGTGYR